MFDNVQYKETVKTLSLYQSCRPSFTDIISCYISSCGTNEDINEYEKHLLEKCFDENDNICLGRSASYEPPFIINTI